jgi:hypothetical protein
MKSTYNFDVLVIGGGASGSAAGIQSARLGAKTLIIEETPWLGGMITSAGVSAFDGNKYALGGGIFGELRKKIEDYYGGHEKTFTGWISLTCFEPKIGKDFLHEMARAEENLKIWFESKLVKVLREKNKIVGALVKQKDGTEVEVRAKVTVEATEFGDVLALGKVPYRLGRDSKSDTGEQHPPNIADDEIQDMTFCAILKNYKGKAPEIKASSSYNPLLFKCSTAEDCDNPDETFLNHKLHNWESFITYAALPNDKYLLNWPFRSNDYLTTRDIYENPASRDWHYKKAKEQTLNYIHYIQTKLGHPEWGLATDEFPTSDHLPFIPYVRESRRVKGLRLMVEEDVIPAKNSFRPELIEDSIAVGDYFLDHHHSSFFKPPSERLHEKLPANAPFQVSYQALIPETMDGLIAAEKSISVSHIVNGCTRLQPVVMLIGQAAGAAAALSVKQNVEPRNLDVHKLQKVLLDAGCQLFPYKDLWNHHPDFYQVQHLALNGVFVDSDEFTFGSDGVVNEKEAKQLVQNLKVKIDFNKLNGLKRSEAYSKIFGSLQSLS